MAFNQLDWLALFVFGLVIGLPFILEFLRMGWIVLPEDFGAVRHNKKFSWYNRSVCSVQWYTRLSEHVGWMCPRLWTFPFLWLCAWILGTAGVWFVWHNRDNYGQQTWDGFMGLQMAMVAMATTWHVLFLRSESYVRSAVLGVVLAAVALASLGIALSGSFSGDDTTPDGFLYLFYALYWTWAGVVSVSTLVVSTRHGLTQTTNDFIYTATRSFETGGFVPNFTVM
jgi:tryptophan-rich sensory protein